MRVLSAALLLLLLGGCDLFGSDADAFVGTWEGRFVEETRVVSTVDQRYAGTERGVPGIGAIEASGAVDTSFRTFEMFGAGVVQVEDGKGFGLFLQTSDGGGYLANNPSDSGQRRYYPIPSAAFVIDPADASLTVAQTVVPTDDGTLTIGGTLAGRPLDLQAGVEADLPRFDRFDRIETLVVADDGTYSRTVRLSLETGTWDADGDALILTPAGGSPSTYTRVGDELQAYGQVNASVDTGLVERSRRLLSGSVASATTSYLSVYELRD